MSAIRPVLLNEETLGWDHEKRRFMTSLSSRIQALGFLFLLLTGSIVSFGQDFQGLDRFIEDDEYWALVDRIKASGYNSAEPIHIRPSRGGVWLVDVDDAARYMAAKHVAGDFFTNLFAQKVRKVRFVLHDTSIDGRHKAPQFEFGGE